MNTENLAKKIYLDLNNKGAGLGDVSITLINKSIKDYLKDEEIHPAVRALDELKFHNALLLINQPGRGTINALNQSDKVGIMLNGFNIERVIDNVKKKTHTKPIVIDEIKHYAFEDITKLIELVSLYPHKLIFIANSEAIPAKLMEVCHTVRLFK